MDAGKIFQDLTAFRRQADHDAALVVCRGNTFCQAGRAYAIDELNGAIMGNEHLFGEVAKPDLSIWRRPYDQKRLILGRRNAGLGERSLAERQEASHGEPEASQAIVDPIAQGR